MFNTQTLAIFNMVDPYETIHYNWNIDQEYSIAVMEGTVNINGFIVDSVNEHRIQPNEFLDATGIGSKRSYFISLFRIDDDEVADQILSESNIARTRTFSPTWYNDINPMNPDTSWESLFAPGHFMLTKDIINSQVGLSNWD